MYVRLTTEHTSPLRMRWLGTSHPPCIAGLSNFSQDVFPYRIFFYIHLIEVVSVFLAFKCSVD